MKIDLYYQAKSLTAFGVDKLRTQALIRWQKIYQLGLLEPEKINLLSIHNSYM